MGGVTVRDVDVSRNHFDSPRDDEVKRAQVKNSTLKTQY